MTGPSRGHSAVCNGSYRHGQPCVSVLCAAACAAAAGRSALSEEARTSERVPARSTHAAARTRTPAPGDGLTPLPSAAQQTHECQHADKAHTSTPVHTHARSPAHAHWLIKQLSFHPSPCNHPACIDRVSTDWNSLSSGRLRRYTHQKICVFRIYLLYDIS